MPLEIDGNPCKVIEFPRTGTLVVFGKEFQFDPTDKDLSFLVEWEATGLHSFCLNGQPIMANSAYDPLGNRIPLEKMLGLRDAWDIVIDTIQERKLFAV
jgi:hypothetical protein